MRLSNYLNEDNKYKINDTISFTFQGKKIEGRIIDVDNSDTSSIHYHVVRKDDPDKDYFLEMDKKSQKQKGIQKGRW